MGSEELWFKVWREQRGFLSLRTAFLKKNKKSSNGWRITEVLSNASCSPDWNYGSQMILKVEFWLLGQQEEGWWLVNMGNLSESAQMIQLMLINSSGSPEGCGETWGLTRMWRRRFSSVCWAPAGDLGPTCRTWSCKRGGSLDVRSVPPAELDAHYGGVQSWICTSDKASAHISLLW